MWFIATDGFLEHVLTAVVMADCISRYWRLSHLGAHRLGRPCTGVNAMALLQLVLSVPFLSCSEESERDSLLPLLGKPSPLCLYPVGRI